MTEDRDFDDAFEALLAGRPSAAAAPGLVAFAAGARACTARPGRASAELAELIATGRLTNAPLTDKGDPAVRPVSKATGPAHAQVSGLPKRRPRMLITNVIAAGVAKFAAAGAVAHASAGVVITVAAVTGVGAAGALPAAAQNGFNTAISALTGEEQSTEALENTDEGAIEKVATADDGTTTLAGDPAPEGGAAGEGEDPEDESEGLEEGSEEDSSEGDDDKVTKNEAAQDDYKNYGQQVKARVHAANEARKDEKADAKTAAADLRAAAKAQRAGAEADEERAEEAEEAEEAAEEAEDDAEGAEDGAEDRDSKQGQGGSDDGSDD